MIVPAVLLFAVGLTGAAAASPEAPENGAPSGTRVENFRLIDHNDRSIELYHAAEAPAVVLYTHGVGCPIVRRSVPELNRLASEFSKQGVVFYLINANSQDSRADLAEEAREYDIATPILKDPTQRIVHSLGSTRTAEALVLDPKDGWRIRYRGPVDDRFDYGAQQDTAENTYLEDALRAQLAGEPVDPAVVETKGCLINFLDEDAVSYTSEVAPILQEKCVNCHRKGGVGPFAMDSYRRVRGWSDMIRETLRTQRMPPWHADPRYHTFHNSLGLDVDGRRTLLAWIEQGAEQDGEADPLAAPPPARPDTWALGAPGHVVQLPEPESLPASGVFDYRYIPVPSNLEEDRWLRGVEVRPTTEEVVHHALVFIQYPARYQHLQPDHEGGLDGFFASYLPGGNVQPFPQGTAQFVPAGSTFIFQMHYNATGKAETDQTRMGLYFNDGPPEAVLHIRAAANTQFEIPPRTPDHATEATYRFREDATLLGLSPHMHYRGSRFRFDATYPDGREETLLSVPWYEFDWQPMYYFSDPVAIPAGTRIRCAGAFNNTAFNPRNPDPDATVHFGEQSHEEMFIGYLSYSTPYRKADFQSRETNPDGWAGHGKPITAETLAGTTWRIGQRFQLRFEAGGQVDVGGRFTGTWSLGDARVRIETPARDITLEIVADGLFLDGRPLTRVPGEGHGTDPRD